MRAFVVSLTLILFSFTGTSVEAQQLQGKVYCPFQGNRMIVTIVTLRLIEPSRVAHVESMQGVVATSRVLPRPFAASRSSSRQVATHRAIHATS